MVIIDIEHVSIIPENQFQHEFAREKTRFK